MHKTVTIFGLLYGSPSELHTITHEINCTFIYITLQKENSSFRQVYKTVSTRHIACEKKKENKIS